MSDRSRTDDSLTKSGLIESLARNQKHLPAKDVELAVKSLLERMSREMANGERIEIRGFGSFSLHFREPRIGRNPKSGDAVALRGKHVPHFKPGKELRERVDGKRLGPAVSSAATAPGGDSPDGRSTADPPSDDASPDDASSGADDVSSAPASGDRS